MQLKCSKIIILCVFLSLNPIAFDYNSSYAQQIPQYESKLMRLAEILGSLHYLRNLCSEKSNIWRNHMNALIDAEEPSPERRARLYAAFNDAYRAFSNNYYECTEAAINADHRYMSEAVTLTEEILKRFGN